MNNSLKIGLLAALGVLWATGCHPRDGRTDVAQHLLVSNGFEQAAGTPAPALSTDKAHAGRFSVRVDAQHREAQLYRGPLGRLSAHRPRRFTLSAWVWAPDFASDASLVLSINNPDTPAPLLRQAVYAADSGPFGAWKFISQNIDLPNDTSAESQVAIELVAKGDGAVYVDDLRLTELW